jgi:hypothetical protein
MVKWVPSIGNIIENRYMSANKSPKGSPEPSGGHFVGAHSIPCAFAVSSVTTVPSGSRNYSLPALREINSNGDRREKNEGSVRGEPRQRGVHRLGRRSKTISSEG